MTQAAWCHEQRPNRFFTRFLFSFFAIFLFPRQLLAHRPDSSLSAQQLVVYSAYCTYNYTGKAISYNHRVVQG